MRLFATSLQQKDGAFDSSFQIEWNVAEQLANSAAPTRIPFMNAHRLVTVVDLVRADLKATGVVGKLTELTNAVQNAINAPNEANQRAAETAYKALQDALHAAPSNTLSPGLREDLAELTVGQTAVTDLVGDGLAENLDRVFAEGSSTSIQTLDAVRGYGKLMGLLSAAMDDIARGAASVGLEPEYLEPGESIVGMTIPRSAVNEGFRSLRKELRFFDQLLTSLSECVDGNVAEPTVHSLRSSNFGIDITTSLHVATAFGTILAGIAKILEMVKGYRELRKTAESLGVDANLAGQLGKQSAKAVEKAVDEIEAEVFQHCRVSEDGRLNEVKTAVRLKINGLVNRAERGFTFEVRTELPEVATPEQEQAAQAIGALSRLRFEPIVGPRLLELPEEEDPERAAEHKPASARQTKKKKAVEK